MGCFITPATYHFACLQLGHQLLTKLLWAIGQANNTRNPNLSLVKLYLEIEKPGPQKNDLEVRHKSLTIYDELLQEGVANHEPDPM